MRTMFELNEEVRARRTRSKENVEVEGRDSGVFTHHNTNSLQSEVEFQYQSHLSSTIVDISIYNLNLRLLASICFRFTSMKTPDLKECERRWKKHNPLKSVEIPTFFSLGCKKDAVLALPKISSNILKHLNCISTQFCFSSSVGDCSNIFRIFLKTSKCFHIILLCLLPCQESYRKWLFASVFHTVVRLEKKWRFGWCNFGKPCTSQEVRESPALFPLYIYKYIYIPRHFQSDFLFTAQENFALNKTHT